jgi:hypothetical protein
MHLCFDEIKAKTINGMDLSNMYYSYWISARTDGGVIFTDASMMGFIVDKGYQNWYRMNFTFSHWVEASCESLGVATAQ